MKKKKVTAVVDAGGQGFGNYSSDLRGTSGYGDKIEQAREVGRFNRYDD